MSDQNNFKSRLISSQKPLNKRERRKKAKNKRSSVDMVALRRKILAIHTYRKTSKIIWLKTILFLVAIPSLFLLGYSIAALSVSMPVKVLILIPIAIIGLILSYVIAALAR